MAVAGLLELVPLVGGYIVYSVGALVGLLVIYLIGNEYVRWRARIPGINGPRGLPVIGNLHQLRNVLPSEQYRIWAQEYGPVFQIQLGNMPIILVNSASAAKQMFLAQGSALNSRPIFHVFHGILTKSVTSIGTSPWSESCKRRRKAAATALNKAKTESYFPIIKVESTDLIKDLFVDGQAGKVPVQHFPIVQRFSLNLVLTLNYGFRLRSSKDVSEGKHKEITFIESEISRFRSTSKNLSNYIPLLRILEPFQKANKEASETGRRRNQYNAELLEDLRRRIQDGTDIPCIQGNVLKDPDAKLTADELTSISLSMMAGSETNTPMIEWALMFLSRMPSVQEKAYQAIVDAVGKDFDPLFDGDIDYIMGFTKEILRYFTPLRMSLPRATWTEAHWQGAKIPPNTAVFLNAWACNRDPEVFPDPDSFIPERWYHPEGEAGLPLFAFGFGTRMCVAYHLATRALYVVFLHLLANYKIFPEDHQGTEFGEDDDCDLIHPLKGVVDPTALGYSPLLLPLKFVPRDEERLREAIGV